jgi:hypothetical protein
VSFPNVFIEIGCFCSGHPSAHFWPPISYSMRFSTVFTRGRFHPPIFHFYSFADDSMSRCHFQMFHRNRLFLFRSPVSPCLHPVSYSTRFSTIFTRGHFHPPSSVFPRLHIIPCMGVVSKRFHQNRLFFVPVAHQPIFVLPRATAHGFQPFSSAAVFIPPSSISPRLHMIQCLGVISKFFHQNRLFSFRSPVSPFLASRAHDFRPC